MVVFSSLRQLFKKVANSAAKNAVSKRSMSGDHHDFVIQPTRWDWNKFKDYLHFYIMLGVIPCSVGILYSNVFIGPATLSELPEDYVPKYWEYYRHPISRFIARYLLTDPQQNYEKMCAYLFMEEERRKLRIIEEMVKDKMSERNDYQAYYYRPVSAKYYRLTKEAADKHKDIDGSP